MVLNRDGLPLEATEELLRLLFRRAVALVLAKKRFARKGIGVFQSGVVGSRATGLKIEPEEAFGFVNVSGSDLPGGGGPGLGLFTLEPAPEWHQPAAQEESEPDIKKPGPGLGVGPAKGRVEVDKPGCGKTVQRKLLLSVDSCY